MKQYEVNLSSEGIKTAINRLKKLQSIFSTNEFMQYIASKCLIVLQNQTNNRLLSDLEGNYTHNYRNNHKLEVNRDEIVLYNNTMVDLSNVSEETRLNYPNGLSLAKMVEYGTGIVGSSSEASTYAQNWQYDVNNHGNTGWFFELDGKLYWSKGIEGRLIYLHTKIEIENLLPIWINDYIENKLK